MKAIHLLFLLTVTTVLAADPFQLIHEQKKEIRKEDVTDVSIRFSLKKSFPGITEPVWVTEEIHFTDTNFGAELANEVFNEKEQNIALVDSFYIGEPVLAFIVIHGPYGSDLLEIPIGIHEEKEKIEAAMLTTKATQKVFRFLKEYRPEAISDYILGWREDHQRLEALTKRNRSQIDGG